MATIHKLTKDGATIFPATITDAVVHQDTGKTLTSMIKEYNVSELFPTEGIAGGNTYNLALAVQVLGTHLRASEKTGGIKLTFISSVSDCEEEYYLSKNTWSGNVSNWKQRFEVGEVVADPSGSWDPSTAEQYIDQQVATITGDLAGETVARQTADTNLQNQVDTLAAAVGTGGTVDQRIQAEATTRANADTALSNRITPLEQAVGSGGSIDTRISNAKSEIRGNATSACDTLGEAEALISAEETRAQGVEATKADKATTLAGYGITDAYTKTEVNDLVDTPHQNYVTVQTYSALPTTGSADTIYRVSNYDGSVPEVNVTKYSEYSWNGSQYIFLCVKSQIDEVFDITVYHSNTTYSDLAAALGTDGANIPSTLRRGGMSIKYVQTSDNNYMQARLMADEFTTDISEWQVVDNKPTAGSRNLVESGGVADKFMKLFSDEIDVTPSIHAEHSTVDANGNVGTSIPYIITSPIRLSKGFKIRVYARCATIISLISKTDVNSSSYEPLVMGKSDVVDNIDWVEYTATEDCYIALSYRNAYSGTQIKIVSEGTISKEIEELSGLTANLGATLEKAYQWANTLTSVSDEFTDLDTYPLNRTYKITNTSVAANVANKPDGVTGFAVFTFGAGSNVRIQLLNSENKIYYRAFWGSKWSNWVNIDSINTLAKDLQNVIVNILGIGYIEKNTSYGYITWSDSELVGDTDSRFYHSAPITLLAGETITANIYSSAPMAAIAKHEVVDNNDVYTRLVRGASSSAEIKTYTYTASEDIEVVISGYKSRLSSSIWYINKAGVISDLENKIDDARKDCTINIFSAFDNIVSVGDSLTYCAVYENSTDYRQAYNPWPKQIAQRCGITNSGIYAISGGSAKTVWNTFGETFEVPQNKKSICTIYLGTNNYFSDTLDTDAPEADAENYRSAWANTQTGCMCKIIQTFVNFGCKILIILPHAGGTAGAPDGWTLNDTRDVIMKMITRFKCAYVDDRDIYVNAANAPRYHYYSDLTGTNNLHYNDLGYAYFASRLIDMVGRLSDSNMKWLVP